MYPWHGQDGAEMNRIARPIPLSIGAQSHQMFIMELEMYGELTAKLFVQKLNQTRRTSLYAYWQEHGYQDYLDNFVVLKEGC